MYSPTTSFPLNKKRVVYLKKNERNASVKYLSATNIRRYDQQGNLSDIIAMVEWSMDQDNFTMSQIPDFILAAAVMKYLVKTHSL